MEGGRGVANRESPPKGEMKGMHEYVCAYIYVCVCVCMSVDVCMCTRLHTHTTRARALAGLCSREEAPVSLAPAGR